MTMRKNNNRHTMQNVLLVLKSDILLDGGHSGVYWIKFMNKANKQKHYR
jgi:hypothetical protein